jgi:hypothetical protein
MKPPDKRALLVGINEYEHVRPLEDCVNDVKMLLPLLKLNEDGSGNFECRTLTSGGQREVGRKELLSGLSEVFAPGVNVALFYFAGHGFLKRTDVLLVAQDGQQPDLGVPLSTVLTEVQESTVPEVIIILDCCFSGAAGGVPQLGVTAAVLRTGLSLLTASRSDQTANEEGGQGRFSKYLKGALEGGAADVLGDVTLAGVYSYISESFGAFDQRPTFKANVDRLHVLRRCAPAVPIQDLRSLSNIFKSPDHELKLNPSYEPTARQATKDHVAIMAMLQRYRAARLVEPLGTQHLYYAAMEKKRVRLTALGKHYWRLADQDLM